MIDGGFPIARWRGEQTSKYVQQFFLGIVYYTICNIAVKFAGNGEILQRGVDSNTGLIYLELPNAYHCFNTKYTQKPGKTHTSETTFASIQSIPQNL